MSNTRWNATSLVLAFATFLIIGGGATAEEPPRPQGVPVADRIVSAVAPPALADLLKEVLAADPEIAAAAARARAARRRVPQAASLPDPTAMVTAFLSSPETRVGPQRLAVAVSQALPWWSKLASREKMALWDVAALEAEVEKLRLAKITEARRLYLEIAFLDEQGGILERKRQHLLQHEEAARARYSTGIGESQGVVKLQAEITRVEAEQLALATRRQSFVAALAALRGRSGGESTLPRAELPRRAELRELPFRMTVPGALAPLARRWRPEITAAEARIERARVAEELAHKERRPDFTVGLTYTVVDPREDRAGRLNPPERNGSDVVGIQGGVRIPLWRERLTAAVEEATQLESVAVEGLRQAGLAIERQLDELSGNLPLHYQRIGLFEDVLVLQADEALSSAEAGYIAGRFSALDLLDAEHVLFDAYTAAARARADYAISLVRLEGAVGVPLAGIIAAGSLQVPGGGEAEEPDDGPDEDPDHGTKPRVESGRNRGVRGPQGEIAEGREP